jgi:hypothetical protein
MRKILVLILSITMAIAAPVILLGCGGGKNGAQLLQDCGKAVQDYVSSSGYIKFSQEMQYGLGTADGGLEQKISMQGTAILPERQDYEYQETIKSSKTSDETTTNSFTYLTLDGGKTAFVKGEMLSAQLGVVGWVHYTPPADQNRFFNFPELMSRLTTAEGDVEILGSEEVSNTTCVHLAYSLNGEDLLNLQLQQNPSLQQQYEGIDLSQIVGDLRLEIWIGEEDNLPRRSLLDQSISENGITSTTQLKLELSGYGQTPLVPIEQPAFFNEAQS